MSEKVKKCFNCKHCRVAEIKYTVRKYVCIIDGEEMIVNGKSSCKDFELK